LPGAVVMAPMTKGSNLPYRRLAIELGARVLVSEMVVARRLRQRRRGELALVRRAPGEPCFGVQLAGNKPEEVAFAAAMAEARGADFIDLNLGCPIDHFTRMGLGAALGRQPNRARRIVEAMRAAVKVPVTVKIRLGWNDDMRNYLDAAKALVDGGAAALTVHGRTRQARYRHPAEWDAIAEVAAAVNVPVVGNGDLLFPHEIGERIKASGCAAVMIARGALIKPWIFREMTTGYWDITAEERLTIYRRYVELAKEHWGRHARHDGGRVSQDGGRVFRPGETPDPGSEDPGLHQSTDPGLHQSTLDEYGRTRLREFLRWHVGFWCRYVPRRADGTWPSMQQRESLPDPRSPLEALFARSDEAALEYVTDELLNGGDLASPPAEGTPVPAADLVEAG
jgi:tRNA-dihydrouridine synthase 3